MERKTKNRILGIIVMAALVVALLPLFHGSSDVKPDPQATNVPPFPDQSAQLSDNANPEFKMALANQVSPIPFKNNQDNDDGVNQLPDDTINPNTSRAYNNINKAAPVQGPAKSVSKPVAIEEDNDTEAPIASIEDEAINTDAVKAKPAVSTPEPSQTTENIFRNSLESEFRAAAKPTSKKTSHRVKPHDAAPAKMKQVKRKAAPVSLDENGLFKLKKSAWVIQLGSYKDKTTALRLVNRLRANGYSAFIQQASAGTRVYVGPEAKQDIARSIATRLEYEMKLQGFVISYKPLTL